MRVRHLAGGGMPGDEARVAEPEGPVEAVEQKGASTVLPALPATEPVEALAEPHAPGQEGADEGQLPGVAAADHVAPAAEKVAGAAAGKRLMNRRC